MNAIARPDLSALTEDELAVCWEAARIAARRWPAFEPEELLAIAWQGLARGRITFNPQRYPGSVRAWTKACATGWATDWASRNGRRRRPDRLGEADVDVPAPPTRELPDLELLERRLARLPRLEREVLLAWAHEETAYHAAARLGIGHPSRVSVLHKLALEAVGAERAKWVR